MIIRKTFWFVSAALFISVVGSILTRADIYFRLAYLCILLIITSLFWAYFSIKKYNIQRHSRGLRQQLGQVFEEQFEVTNKSRFSRLWLKLEDKSDLPGKGGSRILSWIGGNTVRRYSSYHILSQRGEFLLSPIRISAGDPFGLFAFSAIIENPTHLLVLPYFVDLRKFPFPSGFLPGGKGQHKAFEMSPPQIAGIREYSPGDPLNQIHWPMTAKRDRLIVKEFEEDPRADIWIFLDSQKKSHNNNYTKNGLLQNELDNDQLWWLKKIVFTLPNSSYEYGISISASVANYFISRGQVVGFVSDGRKTTVLPAEKGERQLNKILETLSYMKCEGSVPIGAIISSQAARLPRGSAAVIISTTDCEHIQIGLTKLIQKGIRPVVILVDINSFYDRENPSELFLNIKSQHIPIIIVKKGEDIKKALETNYSL